MSTQTFICIYVKVRTIKAQIICMLSFTLLASLLQSNSFFTLNLFGGKNLSGYSNRYRWQTFYRWFCKHSLTDSVNSIWSLLFIVIHNLKFNFEFQSGFLIFYFYVFHLQSTFFNWFKRDAAHSRALSNINECQLLADALRDTYGTNKKVCYFK